MESFEWKKRKKERNEKRGYAFTQGVREALKDQWVGGIVATRTGLVPSDQEGALGVREADLRARQREDFFLLLQRG